MVETLKNLEDCFYTFRNELTDQDNDTQQKVYDVELAIESLIGHIDAKEKQDTNALPFKEEG